MVGNVLGPPFFRVPPSRHGFPGLPFPVGYDIGADGAAGSHPYRELIHRPIGSFKRQVGIHLDEGEIEFTHGVTAADGKDNRGKSG